MQKERKKTMVLLYTSGSVIHFEVSFTYDKEGFFFFPFNHQLTLGHLLKRPSFSLWYYSVTFVLNQGIIYVWV
jgi:hypothetical protein